jgi:hypothetical protein
MEGHVTSYSSQRVDGQFSNPEVGDGSTSHHDVHDDTLVLEFLWTSMVPGMVSAKERDCVLQRAKRYWLEGTHILRVWEDGKVRIVPHPAQRGHIVWHAHEELGHFGVKRTYSLLVGQYWWRDMHTDVQQLVSRCMVCDKVRASFNVPTPQLHPLPIMGLGYRWSLDFARPLPLTVRHSKYVLVMVEHFSKWIELVPFLDKSSEGVAYAFLDRVLSHFGAPTEVLTDQSTEFQVSFRSCVTRR